MADRSIGCSVPRFFQGRMVKTSETLCQCLDKLLECLSLPCAGEAVVLSGSTAFTSKTLIVLQHHRQAHV